MDKEFLQRRVWGCLAGVAVGDAMGMPVEFLTRTQIKNIFSHIDDFKQAPEWHPLSFLPKAHVTDDTEQTLAIAKKLSEKESFEISDVVDALLEWSRNYDLSTLNQIGPSTREALIRLRNGEDPHTTGLKGNTNGAAMKIAPIGIIHPGDLSSTLNDVEKVCIPTHMTNVAISGASAVACAISLGISGEKDIKKIVEGAKYGASLGWGRAEKRISSKYQRISSKYQGKLPWEIIANQVNPLVRKRIEWAIKIIEGTKDEEEAFEELVDCIGTGVLMAETVPLAIGFFVLAKGNPMRAIFYGANAGGDTDTIASISGAIAGAYSGIEAFPPYFLQKVEEVNNLGLEKIARKLVERIKF